MNGIKIQIRKWIESYFYFSRLEKSGILVLLILIFIIQAARLGVAFFYQPNPIPISITIIQNPTISSIPFREKKMAPSFSDSTQKQLNQKPKVQRFAVLELNSADSQELVALYRIGPGLASKIIKYRKQLGGFYSLEQLPEIYGFQEDILFDLEGKIRVDASLVRKIAINKAEFDELKTHPYLKFSLSRQLIAYRKQHGHFSNRNDLLKLKNLNDSIIRKIEPYLSFEIQP